MQKPNHLKAFPRNRMENENGINLKMELNLVLTAKNSNERHKGTVLEIIITKQNPIGNMTDSKLNEPKVTTRGSARKEKDVIQINTGKFDEDYDDLIVLEEIQQTVLYFAPLNEMKKNESCTKLNIHDITPTSNNGAETCTPIEHPNTIKNIMGDGNCFFRAISFCLSGNENNHLLVRKAIVVHLLKNKNKFENRLRDGFANVSNYVTKSKVFQNGTWATEMEIMVLANLIETDIYIYDEQNFKWSIFSGKDVQLGKVTSDKGIYLRHTQGIHYDVVLSVQSSQSNISHKMYQNKHQKEINMNSKGTKRKRKAKKSYSQRKKQNTEMMREKRAIANEETSTKKKEKRLQSTIARKARKSNAMKIRYANDIAYKTQQILSAKIAQNQKYHDRYFFEINKDTNGKRKQNITHISGETFRNRHLNAMKEKYHSDLEYKTRKIKIVKEKYLSNEKFKEKVKSTSRIRYKNPQFKGEHKAYMKNSMNKKYSKPHFRQQHKASMRNVMKGDMPIRQQHKATMGKIMRRRYARSIMQPLEKDMPILILDNSTRQQWEIS